MRRFIVACSFIQAIACAPTPNKTLDVSVALSNAALRVTNTASTDAVGHELTVYINGQPPFAYKAMSTVPAVGEHVELPLMSFTKKDGERFNPFSHAVTVIWIGGGGYDYRSFKP